MWTEYKRTAIIIQLFILALIATIRWRAQTPWDALLFVFIFLQLGALAGAWFGRKLVMRIDQRAFENIALALSVFAALKLIF